MDEIRPASAPLRLDRHRVVAEAVAVLDSEGPEGLTMRRLGRRLGVEAMSLYQHVDNRDDLLDACVEHVLDELDSDEQVRLQPRDDDWRDWLAGLAHGLRRIALAHPRVFPLIASRPSAAPWIRPPLRSLRWVEAFLAGLRAQGFADDGIVYAYRAYTSFLVGHLLLEVAALVHTNDADPVAQGSVRTEELEDYPELVRLAAALQADETDQEFDHGLAALLDRLATRCTSSD